MLHIRTLSEKWGKPFVEKKIMKYGATLKRFYMVSIIFFNYLKHANDDLNHPTIKISVIFSVIEQITRTIKVFPALALIY